MSEFNYIVSDKIIETTSNNTDSFSYKAEKGTVCAFKLNNFKVFQDTNWIKLNKLTLFLGNNSSGKSALVQSLKMMKLAYIKMNREELFWDLSGIKELVGDFYDICYKKAKKQEVIFGFLLKSVDREMKYYIAISADERNRYGIVSKMYVVFNENIIDLLEFYTAINIFFLEKKQNVLIPMDVERTAKFVMETLKTFLESFSEIGTQRLTPLRSMSLDGKRAEKVENGGLDTYRILYSLTEIDHTDVPLIKEWLYKFGYSYYWKMEGLNRGQFILKNIKTGIESNLVDNGYGISQSLPLVLAIQGLKDDVILIDSPEAFLQTKMQSEVADILLYGAKKGRVLVETGSEYIILRVQLRIAEQKLAKEDVSVYFICDMENDETINEEILIDENGSFIHPSNKFKEFFSSDFYDLEKIEQIKRERIRMRKKDENSSD